MRYVEFKQAVEMALHHAPEGLTWKELRVLAELPYERPCPTWTKRLEQEIGLSRTRGSGRSLIWRIEETAL